MTEASKQIDDQQQIDTVEMRIKRQTVETHKNK